MDTTAQATTTKCLRCRRVLRSARSLAAGVGRTCKAKIATAAKTVAAKPAQVEKARELVELAAIIHDPWPPGVPCDLLRRHADLPHGGG